MTKTIPEVTPVESKIPKRLYVKNFHLNKDFDSSEDDPTLLHAAKFAPMIAEDMLAFMVKKIRDLNGVSEDNARKICVGCAVPIIQNLFKLMTIQADLTFDEAAGVYGWMDEDTTSNLRTLALYGAAGHGDKKVNSFDENGNENEMPKINQHDVIKGLLGSILASFQEDDKPVKRDPKSSIKKRNDKKEPMVTMHLVDEDEEA